MTDTAINFSGKIRGANLTSKPGFPLESAYWAEWDWTGWIRPQIDYAMSLGANVVRLIGDVTVVNSGTITQGTYNTRTQQIVKYCVDNGLGYYYTGCATFGTDGGSNGTTSMTDAQIAAIINSNIGSITGVSSAPDYRANIIGCDIVQEANQDLSSTRVNDLYSLIQPNVPAIIPCTFSTYSVMTGTQTWINSILSSCDFLDYHIYPSVYGIGSEPTPTDVTNNPLTNYPTKDFFCGEGGANQSFTSGQITSWIAGLQSIANMASSHVRGCMFWAVQDQQGSGTPAQQYGAFSGTWSPKTEIITPWIQGLATVVGPNPPSNIRIVNQRLIWDPTGCSNAYASTKLYRDGVQVANPIYCYFDDRANWNVVRHKYEVTSVTTGAVESSKSQPFYYPIAPLTKGMNACDTQLAPCYVTVL